MYELLARQRRLLGRVSTAPLGDPERRRDQLGKQLAAEAQGCVDACLSVDAMTADEAGPWLDRLTAATSQANRDAGEFRDEAAAKARTLLTDELRKLAEARANRGPLALAYSRFLGLLRAYEQLDVLSEEECAAWRARATPEQRPAAGQPARAEGYEAFELRRAVAGPAVRKGGTRVISIELYTDCTIARWHVNVRETRPAKQGARRDPDELDLRAQLTDDFGTPYESVDGPYDRLVSVPNAESVRGYTVFVPATPESAHTAAFQLLSERFEVVLPTETV